ncbi:unnamed protein product, partial [Polarella glacialis]
VITIGSDWDGPALTGSDESLSLKAGEQVRVDEVGPDGNFSGTVVTKESQDGRMGWFGGFGCQAVVHVAIRVPLGNDVPLVAPEEEEGMEDEMSQGLEVDTEAYLASHGIDEQAADALRALDPELKAEIIKTEITNSRNPSAVLLSRIDRIKREGSSQGSRGPPPMATQQPMHRPAGIVPPTRVQQRSRSPRKGHGKGFPEAVIRSSPEVEEFIYRLGLDVKVAAELRALPPQGKQVIITTDLTNARNPSAVVHSRIQSIREWDAHSQAVEAYLQRNQVDEGAAAALRALPA